MGTIFVDNIKQQSSQGSGTITIGASGETVALASGVKQSNLNNPSFHYHAGAGAQSISNATWTKITAFTTQNYDTNSVVSSSTFTVPSGLGGKYFLYMCVGLDSGAGAPARLLAGIHRSNGTELLNSEQGNGSPYNTANACGTFNLSAADEIVFRVYQNSGGSRDTLNSTQQGYFGGFRIGT